MAEAVAAAIEWVSAAAGTEMTLTAAEIATASQVIVATAAVYATMDQRRRAVNQARDAFNAGQRDRYVMVRGATEPRRVVLGRQRVSGPVAFLQSYGAHRASLVFVVLLASHECDAVEAIYIDDELAELDGSGNVVGVRRRDQFAISAATGTFTLSSEPAAGTVSASVAYGSTVVALTVTSVTGLDVAVSGATSGSTGTLTITYRPAVCPYLATSALQQRSQTFAFGGGATTAVTLSQTPQAGSISATLTQQDSSGMMTDTAIPFTVSGSVVTVDNSVYFTGGPYTATINYLTSANASRMRVRWHLGAAGQAADAGILAALPDVWTSAHTFTGQCYLVVECDFDTDAFPGGVPQVSAVVRGAKVYDPRSNTTAWSENPALLMRAVATHPLLGNQAGTAMDDNSISAAANICDEVVAYNVGGQVYSRARYTAGTVVRCGVRCQDVLNDLAAAMAGRWVYADGALRVRAGGYVVPLQTLDESWITNVAALRVQPDIGRADTFNSATGKFNDAARDWQELDYPTVTSSTYVSADGATLPLEINLSSVTFGGQAQHVVACMMRDARNALRITAVCNLRAYAVEAFDTLQVNLPVLGINGQPMEVQNVSWTMDGGIELQLKATSATTWDLGAGFEAPALPANTRPPSPWVVPPVTGLACSSGTAELLRQDDGTVVSRIKVTLDAITDRYVLDTGGGLQVEYRRATDSDSAWRMVDVSGTTTTMWLADVADGGIYLVRARAYNLLVSGEWTAPVLHQVVGKTAPPAAVSGLAVVVQPGGVVISVTPSTEQDVAAGGSLELRVGASWASGTRIFRGRTERYVWPWPAAGTYTVRAKWIDSSGNESSTDATASVTVDAAILLGSTEVASNAYASVTTDSVTGKAIGASGIMAGPFPSISITTPGQIEVTMSADVVMTTAAVNENLQLHLSFSGQGSFIGNADPTYPVLAAAGVGSVTAVRHTMIVATTGAGPWSASPYISGPGSANRYTVNNFVVKAKLLKG